MWNFIVGPIFRGHINLVQTGESSRVRLLHITAEKWFFYTFFLIKIVGLLQLSSALSFGDPREGDPWSYRQTELMLVKKTQNNSKQSLCSARVLCSAKGHLTFFSVPPASAKMPLSAQTAAGNLPWLSWWPRGSDWLPRESSTSRTGHKYSCPYTFTGTGALARRELLRKTKKKPKKIRGNSAPWYC